MWILAISLVLCFISEVHAQSSQQAVDAVGSFSTDIVKLLQGPVVKIIGAMVLLGGVAALLRGKQQVALSIGLAVITVLILAISLSSGLRDSARVQSAAQSIQALRSAAEGYLSSGRLNYTGLSIASLKTAGLLPAGFDATTSNPWSGSYTIAANAANTTKFNISLSKVAKEDSTKLLTYFRNNATAIAYEEDKGNLIVTF